MKELLFEKQIFTRPNDITKYLYGLAASTNPPMSASDAQAYVAQNNGLEALRALDLNNYDLVLMDMQMPELDGLETTARIRTKETDRDKHQLVVALTANAMSEDEERCRAAGMDGYLTKPIQVEKLDEVLEKLKESSSK